MDLTFLQSPDQLDVNQNIQKPEDYKANTSFLDRKNEVTAIRRKYPTKIPIVLEKYRRDSTLPSLTKNKFLVPEEMTMSQFLVIVRSRIKVEPTQVIYLLINNHTMLSMSLTMAQAHQEHGDEDGFLYVTYATENFMGHEDDNDEHVVVEAIRHRFPNKIPLYVERDAKDSEVPALDRNKFLVPQELTVCQFLYILRSKIKLKDTQALILLINGKVIPRSSLTMSQAYAQFRTEDGLLRVTYAAQPVFG